MNKYILIQAYMENLANVSIIVNELNSIVKYAKDNNINSLTELKKIIQPGIIDACCKIVSLNKKRKQFECIERDNCNNNMKKNIKIPEYKCYVCRTNVIDRSKTHFCDNCKNINQIKRSISAKLDGKIAVVTGGRVKIGFETAIRLLICGCKVVVTSRFVADALGRYKAHKNYDTFKDRLIIYPLDLRRKSNIDDFCQYMYDNFEKLDILINNAAQTIRRPKEFYEHLIENEQKFCDNLKLLTNGADTVNDNKDKYMVVCSDNYSNHVEQVMQTLPSESSDFFPVGHYDTNNEQIDLRKTNTWISELGEIDTQECVECMAINTLAPFHLNQCLKELLRRANGSYIINVSSMEGVFNMRNKTTHHVHTNIAKAGLNMMTRTSAKSYARDQIYMLSCDTGWITNEFPNEYASSKIKSGNDVPLDNIDGACRVLDPVFNYYNGGKPLYGVFMKDYLISDW